MSTDEQALKARRFVAEVTELAQAYGLNFFVVTDGASAIRNEGNPAVAHARACHTQWERANGVDPAHDWAREPETAPAPKSDAAVELTDFSPERDTEALAPFVVSFWETHHDAVALQKARDMLIRWTEGEYRLYVIRRDGQAVGFLRAHASSPCVCWIDDLFVDAPLRGQGIASAAIARFEEAAALQGVRSFCMEVVPDNLPALRLYHRLGYTRLSLVTVRKDLDGFETARVETIGGLPLRVRRFD